MMPYHVLNLTVPLQRSWPHHPSPTGGAAWTPANLPDPHTTLQFGATGGTTEAAASSYSAKLGTLKEGGGGGEEKKKGGEGGGKPKK